MISKAQIKLVRSLQQKKFRDAYGYFVAEGDKCIDELKKHFELVLLVNSDNATPVEIAQMSSMRTPQGSIAVFKQIHTSYSISERSEQSILLCLDGIQDPGNLGTIIRTADWFGVHDIVCSPETADCYNPKVVQATMGALARVRVHYTDLPQWLSSLRHSDSSTPPIPIFGTLLEGKDIYEVLSGFQPCIVHCQPCIVVMGNEGNGISQPVREYITHPIRIPSYPKDAETSESLNVAIATAITLAEFRRPK
ncbi:MAG: RNA methyltransferase [Paludibacteraceae bacterium]|nr:RNA methyltransferase [Paludibacteraceae bacterium]